MHASRVHPRYRIGHLLSALALAPGAFHGFVAASVGSGDAAGCAGCPGACFAGECLFSGLDLENEGAPQQPPPEPSALAWHSSAQGRAMQTRPVQVTPAQQVGPLPWQAFGTLPQGGAAPRPSVLDTLLNQQELQARRPGPLLSRSYRELAPPTALQQAPAASALVAPTLGPAVEVRPHLAAAGVRLSAAPASLGSAVQAPAFGADAPVASAAAAPALVDPGGPADEERYLQRQLEAAKHADLALGAENSLLRQELARWRAAGHSVAQREARVVDMIKDKQLEGQVAAATAESSEEELDLSQIASSVQTYVFNAGKSPLDDRTNFWRILLVVGAVNMVAFLGWRSSELLQERMLQATTPIPGVNSMLRRAGIGHYVVEISEMQVSHLALDGDIYISVQMGDQEQRTGARELEGRLLRFDERFRLQVKSHDAEGKFVFHIVDRDNPLAEKLLARLEIPAQEVLELARRKHGEYCNFDLFPEAAPRLPRWGGGQIEERRPKLGLRLRDVSLPPKAPKSALKRGKPAGAPAPRGPDDGPSGYGPGGYATFAPPRTRMTAAGTLATHGRVWNEGAYADL